MCTSRIPEFFLIALLTIDGRILHETTITHQPEDTVAHFTVSLLQNVDGCTLHVRISGGNSAGISAPSDIAVTGKLYNLLLPLSYYKLQEIRTNTFSIVCSGDSTDSTTAASTTAGSTVTTVTTTGRQDNEQQGDSSTLIGNYYIYQIQSFCYEHNCASNYHELFFSRIVLAILIGVIAVIGGVLIVAVGIVCYRKHMKNRKGIY